MKNLENLGLLLSPNDNFRNYRESMRVNHATVPCIPYLGLHLADLTFIDEGNEDFENGLINFGKASMIAKRYECFRG